MSLLVAICKRVEVSKLSVTSEVVVPVLQCAVGRRRFRTVSVQQQRAASRHSCLELNLREWQQSLSELEQSSF